MKKINSIFLLIIFVSFSLFSQTTFVKSQVVNLPGTGGNTPFAIDHGDIDNDGFTDILIGTQLGNSIFWYKNDGLGNFSLQSTITNSLSGISDVVLVDLNGDNAIDILASSFADDKLVWYANTLGNLGTFGSEQLIPSTPVDLDGAGDVEAVDLDQNGTIDVAVIAYYGNKVVWFSNDGSGTFGVENTIANSLTLPGTMDFKDADGDGDLDVVVATSTNLNNTPGENNSVVEIFLNSFAQNGMVNFTPDAFSVTTAKDYMFNVYFEDIDNDASADMDVLASDLYGNLAWYKRDQPNAMYLETPFTTTISNPASIGFYDLDISGDGLKDIILSSGTSGTSSDLVWYKNNGNGSYSGENIVDTEQNQPYKFTIDDFDNDGDLDIATIAYGDARINIFNNQKIVLGVDDYSLENISIYPNPATDKLYINSSNTEVFEVTIINMLGKKLIEEVVNANASIDVSHLSFGLYFMRFKDLNYTYKFIKE